MVFKNQLLKAAEFVGSHPSVPSQADRWFQPELTLAVRSPHVDVRWPGTARAGFPV